MTMGETTGEGATRADQRLGSSKRRGWLWSLLVFVALVESVGALSAVPILFSNTSEIPGPGLGDGIHTFSAKAAKVESSSSTPCSRAGLRSRPSILLGLCTSSQSSGV